MSGFLTKLEQKGKKKTVRHCQNKEASILSSNHEETRELPGERDNGITMTLGACRRGRPRTACMNNINIRGQDSPWKSQSE